MIDLFHNLHPWLRKLLWASHFIYFWHMSSKLAGEKNKNFPILTKMLRYEILNYFKKKSSTSWKSFRE